MYKTSKGHCRCQYQQWPLECRPLAALRCPQLRLLRTGKLCYNLNFRNEILGGKMLYSQRLPIAFSRYTNILCLALQRRIILLLRHSPITHREGEMFPQHIQIVPQSSVQFSECRVWGRVEIGEWRVEIKPEQRAGMEKALGHRR